MALQIINRADHDSVLGGLVCTARKRRKLQQVDLVRKLDAAAGGHSGISRHAISRIEHGSGCDAYVLALLERTLDARLRVGL